MVGRVRVLLVPGDSAKACKPDAPDVRKKSDRGSAPRKSKTVAGGKTGAVLTQRIDAAPRARENQTGAQ